MILQIDENTFTDLIHVAKFTAHSLNGASDLAKHEFNLITNVVELPDWDTVPVDVRSAVYQNAWKQLEDEGYEYQGRE